MRFALIGPVHPFRGGIAHHTTMLSQQLADAGHAVQVISFRRQYPRWLVRGRSDRDPSQNALVAEAVYALDPVAPWSWWRVAHLVRAYQPDALVFQWWVTFWAPAWFVIARLVRRWTQTRIIFICHNVLPHESSPVDRALARLALGSGDGAVVHATEQENALKDLVPGLPFARTPLPSFGSLAATDTAEERERGSAELAKELGLQSGTPVLLFFGFVRPYKGLEVLLAAMPQVLAEVSAQLIVAGEIWSGGEILRQQARDTQIASHVRFVDRYIPNEELGMYFALADVVILPYLTATQSAVAQVAYGFGLPVIASAVGGLPDAIDEGKTGLLVPPGDPQKLAEAILRYFRENLGPGMRSNIAAMNADARNRFSWRHTIDALERLTLGGR